MLLLVLLGYQGAVVCHQCLLLQATWLVSHLTLQIQLYDACMLEEQTHAKQQDIESV